MLKNDIEEMEPETLQTNTSGIILGNMIQLKIVYWGPGESGKTTNFLRLKEKFESKRVTRGYSIETNDGRTLWQDSMFLSFEASINNKNYIISK